MTAFSTSADTRNAAANAPPEEIPAKIPSSLAKRRENCSASCCETYNNSSTRSLSKILGK